MVSTHLNKASEVGKKLTTQFFDEVAVSGQLDGAMEWTAIL
jgi:hypothetical protein